MPLRRSPRFITTVKHPVMAGCETEVQAVLETPEEIRRSKSDANVYLFNRNRRWVCAVSKQEGRSAARVFRGTQVNSALFFKSPVTFVLHSSSMRQNGYETSLPTLRKTPRPQRTQRPLPGVPDAGRLCHGNRSQFGAR